MGLQLDISMMYVAVLAAAAQRQAVRLWQLSAHRPFASCYLRMLLQLLTHGSDPEFRKISEDLLISAAVPSLP